MTADLRASALPAAVDCARRHIEKRLSDADGVSCVGLLNELDWLTRVVTPGGGGRGRHPHLEAAERDLWGQDRRWTWDPLVRTAALGTALDKRRTLRWLDDLVVTPQLASDPRLSALRRRVRLMGGRHRIEIDDVTAVVSDLIAAEHHTTWELVAELLPAATPSTVRQYQQTIQLVATVLPITTSPVGACRLHNTIALTHTVMGERDSALTALSDAEAAAELVGDTLVATRLAALVLSNRGSLHRRFGDVGSACRDARAAVRAAPNVADECGAFWFHAERALRASPTMAGRRDMVEVIDQRVPSLTPDELGTDPFYTIRKYDQFVATAGSLLEGWLDLPRLRAHADHLREEYLPGW